MSRRRVAIGRRFAGQAQNREGGRSEIIVQLQDDHTNMSRILDLIEQEMTIFDTADAANFHLLHEIMDYCLDYPEACHHPKEDAIYVVRVSHQPKLEVGIADLTVAHDKLGSQTRHVHDTVERLIRDETMSRDPAARHSPGLSRPRRGLIVCCSFQIRMRSYSTAVR